MSVRRFENGVLLHEEALPQDQIKVRGVWGLGYNQEYISGRYRLGAYSGMQGSSSKGR